MKLIFIDESGNLGSRKDNGRGLEYLVFSAFSIDISNYQRAIANLVLTASNLKFDLSTGKEIKSSNIFSKILKEIKKNSASSENIKKFLNAVLSFPKENGGICWSIIFDKAAYLKQYSKINTDPHIL